MASFTVTLDALQEKALVAATADHNAGFPNEPLTMEQYFQMRALDYLTALVRRYKEAVASSLTQQFEAAPADRQAKFLAGQITLAQLTGKVPIP